MTDWLTNGIRFALYADLMLLFGLPLFCLYSRGALTALPMRGVIAGLAVAGLALSALSIAAMTASMSGVSPFDVDRASISTMITETPMGRAWIVRIVLLVLIASTLFFRVTRATPALVSIAAAGALASLAWTGHGAAGENTTGTIQLIADVIHLGASGAWVGALAALIVILFRPLANMPDEHIAMSHRALEGFSLVGSIIVGLIVVTGLVNAFALVRLAHIFDLPFVLYGQLLLIKLALFGMMLALAASNRFRLTPALERAVGMGETHAAVHALRRSLIFEIGSATIILSLVAWLGTLEPPISM